MLYYLLMKRIPFTISIILLLCFYASAQSQFNRGFVQDGKYYNSGLGFTYTYPKDWTVHGDATVERIKEIGKEKVVESGALSRASTEATLNNSYFLLTVFRHPVGTPGIAANPGLLVLAERVDHAPGITNGKDYLLNVRTLLKRAGSPVPSEDPTEHRYGTWQFFRDDYTVEANGISMLQTYFVTLTKGYAVVFVFTSPDQKSLDEMVKSMETLAPAPPVRVLVDTPPKPKPNKAKPN